MITERIIHVPFAYKEILDPLHKAEKIKLGWDVEYLVRGSDDVLAELQIKLKLARCLYYEWVDGEKIYQGRRLA